LDKHWTEKLFIDKAVLYEGVLEELIEEATSEVEALVKIFSDYQIPSGSTILDLACGIGRHSVLLAEKGFNVTGVDLSPTFIGKANEIAEERSVSKTVEFRIGDMRKIGDLLSEYQGKFNVIVNLFTSLGLYGKEMDEKILRQLHDLATTDGLLIVDIVNRDWLVRNFQARDVTYRDDGYVLIAERTLNLERSFMENVWRYYKQQDGNLEQVETFEVYHRVYSLHELKEIVEESGWKYRNCYGGYDLEPLTRDSKSMLLVAQKQ
jgi:SAM-dependent methyltransferase